MSASIGNRQRGDNSHYLSLSDGMDGIYMSKNERKCVGT